MQDDSIEVIFFDLGGVLIDVHVERFFAEIARACDVVLAEILERSKESADSYDLFERGLIDPELFYTSIKHLFDQQLDYKEFKKVYTEIFILNESVAAIIEKLNPFCQLSIISNTDILHFQYILDNYHVLSLFENPTVSFMVNSKKPEKQIFIHALEKFSVPAEKTLFIDDRPENIEAAAELGMNGIIYQSAENLSLQLANVIPAWQV